MDCSTQSRSFTISWSLLRFMSIELVMLSNHLILCCPLLLLASIFTSIWVFSSELALHIKWPKYWSFSFSISPFMNEYLWLISFRIDRFDLLAVQGTVRSLPAPQFKSISSPLSLLFGSAVTPILSYWKNWSFDCVNFCWQNDLCFLICGVGLSWLSFQGAGIF